jgi:hypothetical protein
LRRYGSPSIGRCQSSLPPLSLPVFFCGLSAALLLGPAFPASSDPSALGVELNKLESQKDGCRAYFVITNNGATAYKVLKLDLIQFQPDGVIGKRFAIDLGPLTPQKRSVKLFDIDTPCDQIGSFLINDVVECTGDQGALANCLAEITPSSLAKQQLTK